MKEKTYEEKIDEMVKQGQITEYDASILKKYKDDENIDHYRYY